MLVLSRNFNQSIVIKHAGEVLQLKVVEVRFGKVRLGLDGPRSFEIIRSELLEEVGQDLIWLQKE